MTDQSVTVLKWQSERRQQGYGNGEGAWAAIPAATVRELWHRLMRGASRLPVA
jgi:hypothetical protein